MEKELTLATPWEDIEARFQAILADEQHQEPQAEFISAIKVNGRPILAPVMTQDLRRECRRWRDEATVRMAARMTTRMEEEEDSDVSTEEDEVVVVESDASVRKVTSVTPTESLRPRSAAGTEAVSSELIHGLRGSIAATTTSPILAREDPLTASAWSVASTVVENPSFRARSGSYTLDEPSPLLKAYVAKYGGDMTSAKSGESRASREGPYSLEDYLKTVSKQPPENKQKSILVTDEMLSALAESFSVEQDDPPKTFVEEPTRAVTSDPADELTSIDGSAREVPSSAAMDVSLAHSISISLPPDSVRSELTTPATTLAQAEAKPESDDEVTPVPEMLTLRPSLSDEVSPATLAGTHQPTLSDETAHPVPELPLWASRGDPTPTPLLPPVEESATNIEEPTTAVGHRASIQDAVSTLAKEQQCRIQELERRQEEQRRQLEEQFKEQQRLLVASILAAKADSANKSFSVLAENDEANRSTSPPVPAASARPNTGLVLRTPLPAEWRPPVAVDEPQVRRGLILATAAAKGWLVRRLMRTRRVANLVEGIRDTLAAALQLHAESSTSITGADVDLHRRLLQQINRHCQEMHRVFFKMPTEERMRIIRADYQTSRMETKADAKPRRLSAVTLAKLQEREAKNKERQRASGKENRRRRARSSSGHKGKA